MLVRTVSGNRGDTLIEVLFAVAIFSSIAIGGLTIMNQGSAVAQRSLEITMVRQEIDSQAEALRFLNASYVSAFKAGVGSYTNPAEQWRLIRNNTVATISAFSDSSSCGTPQLGSFILNTRKALLVSASSILQSSQTFSQVRYDAADQVTTAEGIWIEAIKSSGSSDPNQSNASYIDFHIRACWLSPSQSSPMRIGTIVRLYEPI